MLADYQLWQVNTLLKEANAIIDETNLKLIAQVRKHYFWEEEKPVAKKLSKAEVEVLLPRLGYLFKRNDGNAGAGWFIQEERRKNPDPKFNPEKAGIRQCLVVSYKEEQQKQRDGIRFPPGVIVNKINHRVFNYDQIQDKITALVTSNQLDCCDALMVRIALKDKVHQLGRHVIEMLSFPLKVGDAVIDKRDVIATHERFYRRDMNELRAEQQKVNCGDCGGARSSARWIKPKHHKFQPKRNFSGRR